ncbi:class I adenylate-forming enzyme family protein [Amycolatopsis silviterrae]|uniref:Class I adenylate-forming enzyme family protein n=1 Tax=Amycolatopsis silviterrae TaxID=1656914 RepID=A0ABW5H2S3_9PSEU
MNLKSLCATRFRGLDPGRVFATGAKHHPAARVVLDHDLALYPEAGRALTFATLAALVDDLAGRLRTAGVTPGHYVAVYATHRFDLVLVACAASRLGAVPVMLASTSDGATAHALLAALDRPAFLVTDPAKLDGELAGVPVADQVTGVLTTSGARPGTTALDSLAPDGRPFPRVKSRDEPALVTHSSGTTGLPKLVVQSARSLYWHYRPQIRRARVLRLTGPLATCASFAHVRIWPMLAIAGRIGQTIAFVTDPEPGNAAEMLLRVQPEVVEAYPNVLQRWGELAGDPREPLAGIRLFRSTFDALHPQIMLRLLDASRRRLPLFSNGYGQSELGGIVGFVGTRWMLRRYGTRCVGYPVTGVRIKVVHEDGPDRPGRIYARARGRAIGIIGEQEQYERRFSDGWWELGDVGRRGRFGALYLLDREVDRIDGVDSTLSIEDTLLSRLPELVEIVVVRSAEGTPTPVVCTRDDRPLDPVRWRESSAEFAGLADPLQVRWRDLPATSTWKIRRPELRRRIEEGTLPLVGGLP